MIACLFCHAELGLKVAGWTKRKLSEPVAAPEPYTHVTEVAWYAFCPACSRWMTERDRMVAPVGLLRSVRETASHVRLEWNAECRELLLGHARRIADALGPPHPIMRKVAEQEPTS